MIYTIYKNSNIVAVRKNKLSLYITWDKIQESNQKDNNFDWCVGFVMKMKSGDEYIVMSSTGKDVKYNLNEYQRLASKAKG